MYDGEIAVGMRFLWEPFKPNVTEHIKVIRVDVNQSGETIILSKEYVKTSKVSGDYTGMAYPVPEDRFREAVMLVP